MIPHLFKKKSLPNELFNLCDQKIFNEPLCFRNPHLKLAINDVLDLFSHTEYLALAFGSAIYKYRTSPGDVDFIIPEIKTLDQIKSIINILKTNSKIHIHGFNTELGIEGYRKGNRYVLPFIWQKDDFSYPMDLILYEGTLSEHAQCMDITMGSLYYDGQGIYQYTPFDGCSDLQEQIIRTTCDPYQSLWEDPIRLFRFIRMKQLEVFYYHYTLEEAFQILATEANNFFSEIKLGPLKNQLSKMLDHRNCSKEDVESYLHELAALGLLDKLKVRLNNPSDGKIFSKYRQVILNFENAQGSLFSCENYSKLALQGFYSQKQVKDFSTTIFQSPQLS